MINIEYFLRKKSLGTFECIEGSSHEDRNRVARINGITEYDKVVLDDGRTIISRNKSSYIDKKGDVWNIWNKPKK